MSTINHTLLLSVTEAVGNTMNVLAVMVVHTGHGNPSGVPYVGPIVIGIWLFLVGLCIAVAITDDHTR